MSHANSQPPVVIQTSALDCGPASLSSLLRGIGAPGNYEVLRTVCSTDVDGTSIDALESVAVQAGTDAEQLVLPAEHILAMPELYLPAIAVITLPDGFPHFVVAWRRTRRHVIVMDPAIGIRRFTHDAFLHTLHRHALPVESAEWREWAGSDAFVGALERRMSAHRVPAQAARQLLEDAVRDPSPRGLAVLDAAIRRVEVEGGGDVQPDGLAWQDTALFSCTPTEDEDVVTLRGAVILRAAHFDATAADAHLAEQLAREQSSPARITRQLLAHPALWLAQAIIFAIAIAGTTVAKSVLLQPLVSGVPARRFQSYQLALIIATAVAGVVGYGSIYWAGRHLEIRIRQAWSSLVEHLPDSFVRSRPTSDITERGHLLHRVRELPLYLLRSGVSLGMVLSGCTVVSVLAPRTTPYAVLLAVSTIAIPVLAFRLVVEADFQTRTISGALARFTCDAIVGAEAVQATGAAGAIRYEQANSLAAWRRAQARFISLTTSVRVATGIIGALLAAACIDEARAGAGETLLIAALAVLAVDSGGIITETMRALAESRSSIARATGALETARTVPPSSHIDAPIDLTLSKVSVQLGAATLLRDVDIAIPARCKVAVVGTSGSGKSSLAATLLGWLEPTSGDISSAGMALDAAALRREVAWSAPETRLWNSDLATNVEYGSCGHAASVSERLKLAEAGALPANLAARGDERLGDAGGALSDGEAQRVRFARALGRPLAPLVVLDEPFRGLERSRRARLIERVRATWRDAMVICVMHDIADAMGFDLVLVMANGTVVESGRPDELARDQASQFARLAAAERVDLFDGYATVHLHRASE